MRQFKRAQLAESIEHEGETYVPDMQIAKILESKEMSFKTISNILKREGTKAILVNVGREKTRWIYTINYAHPRH